MLKVQHYLRHVGTLETLTEELSIKVTKHETLPLVILNYDQINTNKHNPIGQECRGLCLEIGTWDIVLKGFNRFFNHGESFELIDDFDWDNCTTTSKEDGSIILVTIYNGELIINTRGSFGDGECGFSGKTWREHMLGLLDTEFMEFVCTTDTKYTFICEFCSLHNKVVRSYREPKLYLLSVMEHLSSDEVYEFSPDEINKMADNLNFSKPDTYYFNDIQHVIDFIEEKEKEDPTWEGVVLRDRNNLRMKVKSSLYVSLHHLRGNDNIFNPKSLLKFILKGETAELLAYFPEVSEQLAEMEAKVNSAWEELLAHFHLCKHIENQKDFALIAIRGQYSSLLFQAKRDNLLNEPDLKKLFLDSEPLLIKRLIKEQK